MAKQSAFGTSIKITAGTAIGNIRSISGPAVTLDVADVTTHDSTGAWEEVVPTILRSGTVTLEIDYDPANAQIKNAAGGLIYNLVQRTSQSFTITLPSTATIVFTAFVTGFTPAMPHDGALTGTVTLKPTGAVTLP